MRRGLSWSRPEEIARHIERWSSQSGECRRWLRSLVGDGYAQVRIGGRLTYVHRIAYELARGPIPAGLEIDHLCGNRACCRVEHLEAVTHATNIARRAPRCGPRRGRYRPSTEAHRAAQRRYRAKRRLSLTGAPQ